MVAGHRVLGAKRAELGHPLGTPGEEIGPHMPNVGGLRVRKLYLHRVWHLSHAQDLDESLSTA